MILSFKVQNFRSFDSAAQFTGISNQRIDNLCAHTYPIPDSAERVLKTSVVYGANGAGKSNLCRALHFLLRMVISNPVKDGELDYEPFAFKRENEMPSLFDLQFCTKASTYRYAVAFTPDGILEERLERMIAQGAVLLYERTKGEYGGNVRLADGLISSATEKRKALAIVAPMQIGSGTCLKVLEALRMGRVLISTQQGLRGIRPEDRIEENGILPLVTLIHSLMPLRGCGRLIASPCSRVQSPWLNGGTRNASLMRH